jgi:phospholipase A1
MASELNSVAVSELDSNPLQKFSLHNDTYFILGENDLKIQFSFKYRLAKSVPLFLAYTQLMFWNVYEKSEPFEDVNYNPEVFYRLIDREDTSFKTLDMGWSHLSNGENNLDTRSLDRVFLRGNYLTTFNHKNLIFKLTTYYIYNEDTTNSDIVNHLGFWDFSAFLFDVLVLDNGRLGLEIRTYAGSKVFDLDQGASQVGLVYKFKTKNFNPSIYLQRFEGFSESLLNYNKRHTELRLGLNFTF